MQLKHYECVYKHNTDTQKPTAQKTIHTQSANEYNNNGYTVDSEFLCLRSNGSYFRKLYGPG